MALGVRHMQGRRWLASAGLLMLGLLAGCRPGAGEGPERQDPDYVRGQKLLSQGRPEQALSAFLAVTDHRAAAPESHLEAGEIYLTVFEDPVAAIYHFRQFLQTADPRENSEKIQVIEQRIETARKEFARSLPLASEAGLAQSGVMDLVDNLRAENLRLKRQLVSANERITQLENTLLQANLQPATPSRTQTQPSRPSAPTQPEAAQNNYTIQPGDTLTRISQKVYNTPARSMDIYQANRDVLASPNQLRPGQKLRIP